MAVAKYDVFEVFGSTERYIGRFQKLYIENKLGVDCENLPQKMKKKKVLEGFEGKYVIKKAGAFRPAAAEPLSERFEGMPKHVTQIKLPGGCRYGG